ncbi:MAG: DoxX family protein [Burkholderiales bacterium]
MLDAARFDPSDGYNLLRIACGAFFVPHAAVKVFEREFSLGFFVKAGFPRPTWWLVTALAYEIAVSLALILGIATRPAAILAAAYLVVAGFACYRVSGGRWYWNFGGPEFCAFWAIACAVVAMSG